ncbi:CBS domain-containing protein [Aromatoleum diolicum]|uniref:CBS domain-containing protein n=1 Tax=Aromatoleum diolicum TaxID=75796 RepID=A0ABX1QCM6_9RHOO|nr:CBS domain-containing protein [Aromatoleum diolicum]
MIVRNWMQTNPTVLGSNTLLSEAKQILSETNLHALPVVDDGRLRGLITRAGCLRAAHAALRSQNPDELNYFSNHVKVKDIMVRNPATIDANDTMEHCLQVGQQHGVGQLPVMDRGNVVGMISAIEMFSLAAHFLGAWEKRSGVTLAPMRIRPGTIGRITDIVEGSGAEVHAIYPINTGPKGAAPGDQERKVIIRFHIADTADVIRALADAGYEVIESVQATH